jgi:hypothetical protein
MVAVTRIWTDPPSRPAPAAIQQLEAAAPAARAPASVVPAQVATPVVVDAVAASGVRERAAWPARTVKATAGALGTLEV